MACEMRVVFGSSNCSSLWIEVLQPGLGSADEVKDFHIPSELLEGRQVGVCSC